MPSIRRRDRDRRRSRLLDTTPVGEGSRGTSTGGDQDVVGGWVTFHRFLDRALVVPTIGNDPDLAFFRERP